MDKLAIDQLSLREVLVALPLFGAVLAITYDVGFFYGVDISYFTLFSLSEHILFALQVIPVAFTTALMVPAGLWSYRMGWQAAQRNTPPIPTEPTDPAELERIRVEIQTYRKSQQRYLLGYSVALIAGGLLSVWRELYFAAATTIVIGVSGIVGNFLPTTALRTEYFVAWYFCVFMILAFFLGVQNGHLTTSAKSGTHLVKLTGSVGVVSGVLIRSGEHGVLFYDPAEKQTRFLLWSNVKEIETAK
jgi:hypothetical protein